MTNKTNRNFYGKYQIEIFLDKIQISFFFVCPCLSSFCNQSEVYIWATPNKVTPNEIQFEANENYFHIYVYYEKQKILKEGINKQFKSQTQKKISQFLNFQYIIYFRCVLKIFFSNVARFIGPKSVCDNKDQSQFLHHSFFQ